MALESKQERLKRSPPITELLKTHAAVGWLRNHPLELVTNCLRGAAAGAREELLADSANQCDPEQVTEKTVLTRAEALLERATTPRLREAINAAVIILRTGLGRAVFPGSVVDSILPELKDYSTLGVDRESGERIERGELAEYILT
jgi:seryl-tRNA(Sec) selenium transferase